MTDTRTIDDLKDLGQGKAAPDHIVALYHEAFREFGALALWNRRACEHPTIAQAIVIAECLRRDGNMRSRPLAVRIEEACRAAL
jgi:hypothetical protein